MSIGVKLTGHDKDLDGGFVAGDVWVAQTMEQDVGSPEFIPLRERMPQPAPPPKMPYL